MSTLNVADINAGMVNVTTGGLKLSNHNGSGNYPNPDTGMLIYDTAAGGVKLYNGSAWDSMGGGELASGTRSERESGATAANFRYNTQDGQHEYYFNNPYSNKSQALWVPMGGRQLIAFEERQDQWSSTDIKWGTGNGIGTSGGGMYHSYEFVFNFYEQNSGNGEYYIRFIDCNGNVDTNGGRYFYMVSGWHANDGRPRAASGTGGRSYFALTAQDGSYELQSNGEASYTVNMFMSNTPNSSTANYWSYWMHGGGATEQNGGEYRGGGTWRGASQKNGTGYPLGGIRIYNNTGMRPASQGCNFACAVYTTMPSIRDYPRAGSYVNY